MVQSDDRYVTVRDRDGVRGTADVRQFERGAPRIEVAFDNHRLLVAHDDLEEQADGSYRIPIRLAEWVERDAEAAGGTDAGGGTEAGAETEVRVIPLMEEELDVGKRRRQTRVRVSTQVEERDEEVDVPFFTEEVEVERVPVNREVDEVPDVRREGTTVILPVLEEVLVVRRQLVLKEEVHIKKKQVEHKHRETVRLRRENVNVERLNMQDDEQA